jgi:hypothetical protein
VHGDLCYPLLDDPGPPSFKRLTMKIRNAEQATALPETASDASALIAPRA